MRPAVARQESRGCASQNLCVPLTVVRAHKRGGGEARKSIAGPRKSIVGSFQAMHISVHTRAIHFNATPEIPVEECMDLCSSCFARRRGAAGAAARAPETKQFYQVSAARNLDQRTEERVPIGPCQETVDNLRRGSPDVRDQHGKSGPRQR